MGLFGILSLVLVTAALFAWINHRFVRLPTTIGVMLIALGMSLGLLVAGLVGPDITPGVERLLDRLDFKHLLLDVMLAFLLFAGALHVKLDDLFGQKWVISILATAGVLLSTALVGGLIHAASGALGLDVALTWCLVFGALISPTDPIAVLGILKLAKAPKSLETKITGESLFNDGIGVVVFGVVLAIAVGDEPVTAAAVARDLLVEVGGAVIIGLAGGWLAFLMLRGVDDYKLEVLITLALCTGAYSLASLVHASGPIAVVLAGLLIGNTGRASAMSETTVRRLDTFWELVDEVLNVMLFVLIGMEVLVMSFALPHLLAGLVAIPLVLLSRLIAVSSTVGALRFRREFTPHAIKIMTWAGLRGGISVALALSIPDGLAARELIVSMTYVVVVFSIVVQGLTVGKLARLVPRDIPVDEPADAPAGGSHR
jgi:CPA1 family monovalent cation:H+ antiporter